jgi:hypothetical protein
MDKGGKLINTKVKTDSVSQKKMKKIGWKGTEKKLA